MVDRLEKYAIFIPVCGIRNSLVSVGRGNSSIAKSLQLPIRSLTSRPSPIDSRGAFSRFSTAYLEPTPVRGRKKNRDCMQPPHIFTRCQFLESVAGRCFPHFFKPKGLILRFPIKPRKWIPLQRYETIAILPLLPPSERS